MTPSAGSPEAAAPSDLPLVIVALSTLLALVIFTAPLTTLAEMTADLGLDPGQQAWVMSGMPLGAASGLLIAGALGDTLGRRRTFVGGLWVAAAFSVVAALAPSGPVLIAARVIQGLGGAGVMACGLGLLGQIYAGPRLRRASGVWAAGLGAGVALGPILASLLIGAGGWQGIHWLTAAASAGLALAARVRLPESPRRDERVDLPGGVLLMAGLACLLAALTALRAGGGGVVAGLAAAGLVLVAAFVAVERRTSNPILRLDLFRRPDFLGATAAAFASGAGVLALMSMVPTLLVRGQAETPLVAAVILLAWSGVTVVAALGARWLPEGIPPRTLVAVALTGCVGGQLLMLLETAQADWTGVLPGLFLAGVSNGVLNASLGHAAVLSVPPERTAMGSAANNTARYLGSAVGIALISLLIAGEGREALFDGWRQAVLATSALGFSGVVAMLLLGRPRTQG